LAAAALVQALHERGIALPVPVLQRLVALGMPAPDASETAAAGPPAQRP
jgi:hypothetical protein